MKSNHIDLKTQFMDYIIHITWPNENDRPKLTATIINSQGSPIPGFPRPTRQAKSKNEIQIYQDQLFNECIELIKQEQNYAKLFRPMEEILNDLIDSQYLDTIWAASTIKQRISYFRINVLPYISRVTSSNDFGADKLELLTDELTLHCLQHGNFVNVKENARQIACRHLAESQIIYTFMREIEPALPEITLSNEKIKFPPTTKETIRYLPSAVARAFEKMIKDLAGTNPILARAIVLFYECALRSAEAAAVTSHDIEWTGDFYLLKVNYQEKNGNRDDELKTVYSYRKIPCGYFSQEILDICNATIPQPESIIYAPLKATVLSATVRKMLIEAGLSNDYFKLVEGEMLINPETDDKGIIDRDVEAHILRRNRSSIYNNYLAITAEENDYLLGHKPNKNSSAVFDSNNYENFLSIFNRIKNYSSDLFLGEKTNEDIIILPNSKSVTFGMHQKYVVLNSSSDEITINMMLSPSEPGDIIAVKTLLTSNIHINQHNIKVNKRDQIQMLGSFNKED